MLSTANIKVSTDLVLSEIIKSSVIGSHLQLTRSLMRRHQKRQFKVAGSTRADVILSEVDGRMLVMKDYQDSSKGFSMILAPWLVHRECRALQQLDHVDGIPRVIGKIDSKAFVMEFIPASSIREVSNTLDWPVFIGGVELMISQLHDAGVVHGDLRNATNILVSENQQPVFVDFVSAVRRGYQYNPFSKLLYQLCVAIDLGAIRKLKCRYAPQMLTRNEVQKLNHKSVLERSARWCSHLIRHSIQKLFP